MKKLFTLFLLAFSVGTFAQTLTAKAYPSTAIQPDTAHYTVNGGVAIPCTLPSTSAGLVPTCNISQLANGTHTIVLTVTKAASIVNSENGAVQNMGGSASSAPFVYEKLSGTVAQPVQIKVGPLQP